jgi:hypothetical protein
MSATKIVEAAVSEYLDRHGVEPPASSAAKTTPRDKPYVPPPWVEPELTDAQRAYYAAKDAARLRDEEAMRVPAVRQPVEVPLSAKIISSPADVAKVVNTDPVRAVPKPSAAKKPARVRR